MRSSHSRAARSAALAELIVASATAASATEYFRKAIEVLLRLRLRLPRLRRRSSRVVLLVVSLVVRGRNVGVAIVFRKHAGQDRAPGERRRIFAVRHYVVR